MSEQNTLMVDGEVKNLTIEKVIIYDKRGNEIIDDNGNVKVKTFSNNWEYPTVGSRIVDIFKVFISVGLIIGLIQIATGV